MANTTNNNAPATEADVAAAKKDGEYVKKVLRTLALTGRTGFGARDERTARLFAHGAFNRDVADALLAFVDKVDLADGFGNKAERVERAHESAKQLMDPGWNGEDPHWREWLRAIAPYRARENATRKLEALDELAEKNGSEKHTQAWLVNELKRIRSLEAKDRKKSALALIERLALNALPPGVCSTLENLYSSFSEERLKRSIAIIASSWK